MNCESNSEGSSGPIRRVSIQSETQVCDTFSSDEYDRTALVKRYRMLDLMHIADELKQYKSDEMEVHPDSACHTHHIDVKKQIQKIMGSSVRSTQAF
eukprot:Clim_evm17s9 gene=Clim_evmTU17s9